jgi:DNA processing protein
MSDLALTIRDMDPYPLEESIALLAALRLRPEKATWERIAIEVQIEGSAVAYLNAHREAALIENPGVGAALETAEAELTEWEDRGLDFIPILSERYPARLAGVFDAPPFLFAQGAVLPEDRGMSVVGSRRTTKAGEAMARDAVPILAERGLTVIAGLADGIDTVAHRSALDIGARTVAVIGTGIAIQYPAKNRQLQEVIAEQGLVISQFYPDQPPTKNTFPKRNGTMSGYGLATIVIEAGEYSGTRIQARKAAEHGRPVILSKMVAETTEWGRTLASSPWVWVLSSRPEIEAAVDQIIADQPDAVALELGLAR